MTIAVDLGRKARKHTYIHIYMYPTWRALSIIVQTLPDCKSTYLDLCMHGILNVYVLIMFSQLMFHSKVHFFQNIIPEKPSSGLSNCLDSDQLKIRRFVTPDLGPKHNLSADDTSRQGVKPREARCGAPLWLQAMKAPARLR